jgi:diguanylate cyclase (GGDEF)-like protein
MIKDLVPNFESDSRKLIASKTVVIFSFYSTLFFSVYNFLNGAYTLLYIDFSIFCLVFLLYLLLRKKDMYLLGKVTFFIMTIGLIFLVYESGGRDNLYLWTFIGFFYIMLIFGPKDGLKYTMIFFVTIFYIMFMNIGDSITAHGYARFVVVSLTLLFISYAYERSIEHTIVKLKKTQKDLEKISKEDSLTSLYNRRYFDELFSNQIKIAKRNHRLFVFAIADIDDFKKYNDSYGHQSGDKVLKLVARCFSESIQRPDDYAFRLGGEEFGLFFQADDREDGIKLIEKVRKKVEDLNVLQGDNSTSLYLTISVGVHIVAPTDKDDYDEIYKIADDALYLAKQKGKNKIEEL